MNLAILQKEVQTFIKTHLKENLTKLILKGSPFKDITIQEIANQITSINKSEKKLPTWFKTDNIYYPNKLNIEQTSSELTANYKASLVTGKILIDLTGGFGVDCLAFSKQFGKVIHCELNKDLSEIATHNYIKLVAKNIQTITTDGIEFLTKNKQQFDCIYIDPSRRDDLKKRVFLLADCLPNLPKNLDLLFKYSNTILVKTAPLLDINAAINELAFVKEIHIVALKNDVKEVLYLLENGYTGEIHYKTINFVKNTQQYFNFNTTTKEASYATPKKYLFEPNAAILKAGAFQELAIQLNINKLHKHSHLYTANEVINFPGRSFEIKQVIPFNLKKIKQLISRKKANITTRNFPETVAQIRKKTKLKDGGNLYLFFTTDLHENKVVIFCKKI